MIPNYRLNFLKKKFKATVVILTKRSCAGNQRFCDLISIKNYLLTYNKLDVFFSNTATVNGRLFTPSFVTPVLNTHLEVSVGDSTIREVSRLDISACHLVV